MSRKTVYYHDPLHDDFAPTNGRIHPKQIGADFPYEHKGPLWNALAFVVYRMVMTPFLFLYCKLVFGLRIENRKALRALPDRPTVFIVSQRTSSIRHADQIVVLDDGKVCGIGTHEELLETCKVYQEIYYSQYDKKEAK